MFLHYCFQYSYQYDYIKLQYTHYGTGRFANIEFLKDNYIKHIEIDADEDEELIEFSDVDYDEDTTEDFGSETKTDLCEDSKRGTDVFPLAEKECGG